MRQPHTDSDDILRTLDAVAWPEADHDSAREAAALALTVYRGHTRDQGTPYIDHPLAVVVILRAELAVTAPGTLLLALLHDALEVAPASEPLVTSRMGGDFTGRLRDMTPDHRLEQRPKRPGDEAAWRAKTARLGPEETLVRLADRVHNLRDLRHCPDPGRHRRFTASLVEFYLPLTETVRSMSTHLNAACGLLRTEYERHRDQEARK